jgi:hypothetical protein
MLITTFMSRGNSHIYHVNYIGKLKWYQILKFGRQMCGVNFTLKINSIKMEVRCLSSCVLTVVRLLRINCEPKNVSFSRSHPVVFNNTTSNIFRRNTTDTYILLKYKRQHVSFPIEPSSGQFDSLGLRTLSVCTHT